MTETTPTTVFPRRRKVGSNAAGAALAAADERVTQDPSASGPVAGPQALAEVRQDPEGPAPGARTARHARQPRSADALAWESIEPRGAYARYGKRACNLALLFAVAPFALALSLPIALINWVQFGSLRRVLYCQPRVGRHGRTFSIYKFRTMREAPQDAYDSWSRGQDRLRVTRFGRLLRNTHLDELPQLLNILRGEMDFVGPRPEMVEIDRWACEHVRGFRKRNALLPGITGYAQITQGYAGKDAAAYAKKLAGDELYRRRLSFGLDLWILVRTGAWMLRGRGWRCSPSRAEQRRTSARNAHEAEQADGLSETSAA